MGAPMTETFDDMLHDEYRTRLLAARSENLRLKDALEDAYDAISHALNYHQDDHVWRHLDDAKNAVVEALHPRKKA